MVGEDPSAAELTVRVLCFFTPLNPAPSPFEDRRSQLGWDQTVLEAVNYCVVQTTD
jgi:hypothetical protein